MRFAQHFTGAANFEIVHGEKKAGAEFLHHLYRLKALFRLRGDVAFVGQQEIRVGLMVRAADSSTQLVQLREAKAIGAIDDDGVCGRYIDTGLDDGGTQQDIEALLVEITHRELQLALPHLPVRDADARFRQQLRERFFNVTDGVDFIVQKINLPPALEFA